MPSFSTDTIADFLNAVASPDPTPGGGSVAAVAGAMGASLLIMVAGLTRTRNNNEDERVALAGARATVLPLRDRLLSLADRDTEAYDQVTAAFKQPKGTEAEKARRKDAVQRALHAATLAPLDILRAVADLMPAGSIVAHVGNRSARSDVGVALGLLEAAAQGGALNVRANLESIEDPRFEDEVASELGRLEGGIAAELQAARATLVG
ncbi:MAG: cyclodeaminase/cyclohydrolase family protein [Vicinamibacterales bacterium]